MGGGGGEEWKTPLELENGRPRGGLERARSSPGFRREGQEGTGCSLAVVWDGRVLAQGATRGA
eukprot:6429743-Pyramimonas_sp.AAC.1